MEKVARKTKYKKSNKPTETLKLSNKALKSFFYLYNDYNYYDDLFRCKTYHNEVATYLVVFLKENQEYKKYGYVRKYNYAYMPDGNIQIDFTEDEEMLNNFDKFENNNTGAFFFHDHNKYIDIVLKSKEVLASRNYFELAKNLVENTKGKTEVIREKAIDNLINIIDSEKTPIKQKIDGLNTMGKWLGIEKKEVEVDVNVLLAGINKGLRELEDK